MPARGGAAQRSCSQSGRRRGAGGVSVPAGLRVTFNQPQQRPDVIACMGDELGIQICLLTGCAGAIASSEQRCCGARIDMSAP